MAITLETKPGTKPGTNTLETKLVTNLAASARTQQTGETPLPHPSITQIAHVRAGGGLGQACGGDLGAAGMLRVA